MRYVTVNNVAIASGTSHLVVLILGERLDRRDQVDDLLGRERLDEVAQRGDRGDLDLVLVVLEQRLEVRDQRALGDVLAVDLDQLRTLFYWALGRVRGT